MARARSCTTMKLSVVALSLLAAVALGAVTVEDVQGVRTAEVGSLMQRIFAENGEDARAECFDELLEVSRRSGDVKKFFSKLTPSNIRHLRLDRYEFTEENDESLASCVVYFPESALKAMGRNKVREALTLALKETTQGLSSFSNIPADFFKDAEFVQELVALYVLGHRDKQDKFFTRLTIEQFSKIMTHCPDFHLNRLSGESLNILAEHHGKKASKWISKVTPKFLDSVNKDEAVPLNREVVENLPKDFLNDIKYANHPDDGRYYTSEQLKAFKRARGQPLDFSQVPPKRMSHMSPEAVQRLSKRKEGNLTTEQLNKFSPAQWNEILSNKEGCKLVKDGVHLKNVSGIDFEPKCFGKIDVSVQAYVLTHHDSLRDDVLSYVTADMVKEWRSKSESGLNVLRHCQNTKLLAHIGDEVREEDHPLRHVVPSKLAKKLRSQMNNLTDAQLSVMKIQRPRSLADLRRDAEWVCYRKDIATIIDDLKVDGKKSKRRSRRNSSSSDEGVAGSAWSQLTGKDIEALTTPAYSRLGASMTQAAFTELQSDAKLAMSARAIASLPFLPKLTDYTQLADSAFAHLTASHHGKVNLMTMSNAQQQSISESIDKDERSLFAVLKTEELHALGNARLALLTARQWSPITPPVFKSVLTKTLMPSIPPAACALMTAGQWREMSAEVIGAISGPQAELIGSEVVAPQESALVALKERLGELSSAARASIERRLANAQNQTKTDSAKADTSSAQTFGFSAAALIAGAAAVLLI